jgi:hypothetical protein
MPGADQVLINADIDGAYGAITARAGRFTFMISLPVGDTAEMDLKTLAALVLTRAQAYR